MLCQNRPDVGAREGGRLQPSWENDGCGYSVSDRGGEKHSEFYYFSQRIGWDFLVSSQKGKDVSRVCEGEEMLTRQKREGGTSRHDRQTDRQHGG